MGLIAPQHTLDQIAEWTPKILTTSQIVFVDKENIVLEASIKVRFETQLDDDWVMMTINVGIDPVEAFEQLSDKSGKCLGKWDAY